MARKKKRDRDFITPDLTPLIDVVFLLLIFFLVSSVFKKEEFALLLKLPVAEKGQGDNKKTNTVTIEINSEHIAVDGTKVDIPTLKTKLDAFERTVTVNIRADEEARYKKLVAVLDILQQQRKQNISLITEKKQ